MAHVVEGVASDIEQFSDRVRELERRVSALEGQPEESIPAIPAAANFAL